MQDWPFAALVATDLLDIPFPMLCNDEKLPLAGHGFAEMLSLVLDACLMLVAGSHG